MRKKLYIGLIILTLTLSGYGGYRYQQHNTVNAQFSTEVSKEEAEALIKRVRHAKHDLDFDQWDIQKIDKDLYLIAYTDKIVTDIQEEDYAWILKDNKIVYQIENKKIVLSKDLDLDIAKKFNHNVLSYAKKTEEEKIDFETKTVKSHRLLKDEKRVITKGKEGKKKTIETRTYVNGTLTDTKTEEKIVSKPVDELVHIGTFDKALLNPPQKPKPNPIPQNTINSIKGKHPGRSLQGYSTGNPSWANQLFGGYTFKSTGCVPTALAIGLSGYGINANPAQVGQMLYKAKYFNVNFFGTDGKGVMYGIQHYGIGVRGLSSQRAVEEALLRGNVVLTAQQHGSYGFDSITHMVVLNGYDNGFTHVTDPTYPHKNSRYDTFSLWRDRSYDPIDTNSGFVFYELLGNPSPIAPEIPDKPTPPEKPVEPQKPIEPQNPTEPEQPSEPQKPVEPEQPVEPEKPVEPEQPDPIEPEIPNGNQDPADLEDNNNE